MRYCSCIKRFTCINMTENKDNLLVQIKDLKKLLNNNEKVYKKKLIEKDTEIEKIKKSYNKVLREHTETIDKFKSYYEKEKTKRKTLEKKIEEHGLRRRVKTDDGYERRGKRRTRKDGDGGDMGTIDDEQHYISSE